MQKLWLRADGCSGTLAIPLTTGKERKKLRLIAPPPPPPVKPRKDTQWKNVTRAVPALLHVTRQFFFQLVCETQPEKNESRSGLLKRCTKYSTFRKDSGNVALFSDSPRTLAQASGNVATNLSCITKGCYTKLLVSKRRNKKFATQRRHNLSLPRCKLQNNHVLQTELAKSKTTLHLLKF